MSLKERAHKLRRDIPAVYLALKKQETPLLAKICAAMAIVYALSPIDLIPDFIPVLGYLDDVLLLPLLVTLMIKLIPDEIFKQCRIESEGIWQDQKPQRLIYALPIFIFWVVVIFMIVKTILTR